MLTNASEEMSSSIGAPFEKYVNFSSCCYYRGILDIFLLNRNKAPMDKWRLSRSPCPTIFLVQKFDVTGQSTKNYIQRRSEVKFSNDNKRIKIIIS